LEGAERRRGTGDEKTEKGQVEEEDEAYVHWVLKAMREKG